MNSVIKVKKRRSKSLTSSTILVYQISSYAKALHFLGSRGHFVMNLDILIASCQLKYADFFFDLAPCLP